jgi:hypothetical protein
MRQYKNRMTQQQCTRHKASSTNQGSAAGPPSCRAHNDAYRCQQSEEEQVKYLHGSNCLVGTVCAGSAQPARLPIC